jgi:signal transduction histidine kinase
VARGRLEAVARGQKSALEVFVCGRGEGMLSLECAGGFFPAGLKTKDAKLWFPTAKGLVMADPSQMKQKANPLPPPVYIEEVLADGKSIMTAPLFRGVGETAPAPLVLAKGARRLELKFSALSLTAPEQVRFKHRLEGLDPEWTEADTIRSAVYPSVPPGRYQFQVIACNNDGVWNEKGAALAFTVLPAWWQSGVFRASALIGFAGLIGGGVRYMSQRRLRRKVERLEGQQALERERARIARDLHDDLGVSLTQIALLADMSRRDSASPEELKQTSATVALRARTLVRELDGILWTVNPKNDSLDKLATYLCQFSQQFFRIGTIACRLDVAEGIPNCPLTPEVRHDLFLVIKEALNNVAKHSGATEVWLRLSARNGHFEIRVEDNGRGFSPPAVAETERNGLRNMRTRVKELGGVFDVQSEPGNGTCVRVQFPLENVHAGRVNKSTI